MGGRLAATLAHWVLMYLNRIEGRNVEGPSIERGPIAETLACSRLMTDLLDRVVVE